MKHSAVSEDQHFGHVRDVKRLVMDEIEKYYQQRLGEPEVYQSGWYEGKYRPPREYCVYVLACEGYDENAYGTDEKLKSDWHLFTEFKTDLYNPRDPEKWAWAAYYSDELYYVGYTSNPYERMVDHQQDPDKSSVFLGVFPAYKIEEMRWFRFKEEAMKAEVETAEEYRGDNTFVYQA